MDNLLELLSSKASSGDCKCSLLTELSEYIQSLRESNKPVKFTGIVPAAVRVLEVARAECCRQSALQILSAATESQEAWPVLHSVDVIPLLVHQLQPQKPFLVREAATALANLTSDPIFQVEAVRAGAFLPLLENLEFLPEESDPDGSPQSISSDDARGNTSKLSRSSPFRAAEFKALVDAKHMIALAILQLLMHQQDAVDFTHVVHAGLKLMGSTHDSIRHVSLQVLAAVCEIKTEAVPLLLEQGVWLGSCQLLRHNTGCPDCVESVVALMLQLAPSIPEEERKELARTSFLKLLARLLTSYDEAVQFPVSKLLAELSSNEEVSEQLMSLNVIEPLMAYLYSQEATDAARSAATTTLLNMSRAEEHHEALLQAGIVRPCTYLLTRSNSELQVLSMRILANIAADDASQVMLVQSGVVEPIVNIMFFGDDKNVSNGIPPKLAACHLLSRLASAEGARPLIGQVPRAVDALLELVQHRDVRCQLKALRGLVKLAMVEDVCHLVASSRRCVRLMDALTSADKRVRYAAASVVSIVSASPCSHQRLCQPDCLENMAAVLSSDYKETRTEVLTALANATQSADEGMLREIAATPGLLMTLTSFLGCGREEFIVHSAAVLRSLVQVEDIAGSLVMDCHVLHPLLALTARGADPAAKYQALRVLARLTRHAIPVVTEQLRGAGGVSAMVDSLQDSENVMLRRAALVALYNTCLDCEACQTEAVVLGAIPLVLDMSNEDEEVSGACASDLLNLLGQAAQQQRQGRSMGRSMTLGDRPLRNSDPSAKLFPYSSYSQDKANGHEMTVNYSSMLPPLKSGSSSLGSTPTPTLTRGRSSGQWAG